MYEVKYYIWCWLEKFDLLKNGERIFLTPPQISVSLGAEERGVNTVIL